MEKATTQEASFDKEALQKEADIYFVTNPEITQLFATSDGFLFVNKKFAVDHSHGLEDKTLTSFTNANSIEVVDEEDLTNLPIELSAEQSDLLCNGLTKENYNKLNQLASFLKLVTTDKKAETIIKALEEYKAQNTK